MLLATARAVHWYVSEELHDQAKEGAGCHLQCPVSPWDSQSFQTERQQRVILAEHHLKSVQILPEASPTQCLTKSFWGNIVWLIKFTGQRSSVCVYNINKLEKFLKCCKNGVKIFKNDEKPTCLTGGNGFFLSTSVSLVAWIHKCFNDIFIYKIHLTPTIQKHTW